MRINIQSSFLLLIIVSFFAISCQPKKRLTAASSSKKITAKSKLTPDDFLKGEVVFETFQTKSKAAISLDGKTFDVNLNLRIKKNEVIWGSVTAFAGIEVARVLITPDSIKLMNRTESTYIEKPFSFIHNYTSNKIDFKALEALLLGNSFPFILTGGEIDVEDTTVVIKGNDNGMVFSSRYLNLLRPVNVQLQNSYLGQQLSVRYNNYSLFGTKQLPVNLTIISKINSKNINLNIEYQSPQFDIQQDYPFSVPKRFTLIK